MKNSRDIHLNPRHRKALLCGYIIMCILILTGTFLGYRHYKMEIEMSNNMYAACYHVQEKADFLLRNTVSYSFTDYEDESSLLRELALQKSPDCSSGGLYLINHDGRMITTTDLPIGYPHATTKYYTPQFCFSEPYVRSSDGLPVITARKRLFQDWRIAADIPLSYLSDHYAQDESSDSFYYLLDSATLRILTWRDDSSLGLLPEEVDDPLLPEDLQKGEFSDIKRLRDEAGNRYYCSMTSLRNGSWIMLYYQTPESLWAGIKEQTPESLWADIKTTNNNHITYTYQTPYEPLPMLGLIALFLGLLGIAIFMPKRKHPDLT